MINYLKSHLTVKIFLITVLLFLSIAAVTYGFIVLYVPRFYMVEAEKMPLYLIDEDGGETETFSQDGSTAEHIISYRTGEEPETTLSFEIRQTARTFALTLQRIFLPLLSVVIVTALTAALFYSRYITRPVLRISEVSRRLAALDFEARCDEKRKDELGLLADHLNELSRRLNLALGELQSANAMLREDVEREKEIENRQLAFFSAVSHELKTPVTILKGQLQGMICHVGGYKDRDKYLRRSYEVVSTMENLVKEILTVTRMNASGFAPRREEVYLPQLFTEILGAYEELLAGKELELSLDMESQKPISADRRLLEKVISNLLSNAYHYSPEGEKISVQVKDTQLGVQCSIENTGVHIPEQEIPGLFEAFARREQSRNRETGGSGLGLAIVKMVLELHHFTYRMENTDEGVRFCILCE